MGTKQVGIAEAHRNAWARIAKHNQSMLILEKDWTIGTHNASDVRRGLRDAYLRPEDYILAGSCWYFLCMHAYFIKPGLAARLSSLPDMCSLVGPTPSLDCPCDWLPHYLQVLGHMTIFSVKGSQMSNCFGEGLIQQARWDEDGNLLSSALDTPNSMDPSVRADREAARDARERLNSAKREVNAGNEHGRVALEATVAEARQAEAARRLRAVEASACARAASLLGWDYRATPWMDARRHADLLAQRTQTTPPKDDRSGRSLGPPGRQWGGGVVY